MGSAPVDTQQTQMDPAPFAALICLLYFLAILPQLIHHRFDTTVLIVAGEEFVDRNKVTPPVAVRSNIGYDGQFYFRLAVNPFSLAKEAYGVRIDNLPWRAQRILYPVLAHVVALGQARWVPPALLLVNLAGLVAMAYFAARIGGRLQFGPAFPVVIMLWPSLIMTLGRDLIEIVAAAFLLAAINSYLARRLVPFALFGAAATLTRETSFLFLFGVFAFEALAVIRREQPPRAAIICGLAMVPNLVWRGVVQIVTGESLTRTQIINMDFPLFGFVKAFAAVHDVTADDVFVIVVLVFMLAFLIIVAFCILRWRQWDGLAAGWLVLAALMLCMAAATGALIAPGSSLRAFTECFVVGMIIIAKTPAWRPVVWLPVLAMLWAGSWQHMTSTNW
jgi:hypothetical protein